MRPIIHIGFPKTATTWLQKEFFPNVENIDFVDRDTIIEKIVEPNTFELDYKNTRDYFNTKYNKRILICDEMLVGGLDIGFGNGAFIKEIGNRLKNIFNDAQIIIFIRNQQSSIASAYYQYIRSGGNYSINNFLKRKGMYFLSIKEFSLFSFEFFKYDQTITFYKQLFGEENVNIFLYEDFKNDTEQFLQSFKNKYNFKIDNSKLNINIKKNNRYRKHIINLAKITHAFSTSNTLLKYHIIHIPKLYGFLNKKYTLLNKYHIFGKVPSDLELLGKKNHDFINLYYKQSNLNLIKKHKIDSIKKYNYPL